MDKITKFLKLLTKKQRLILLSLFEAIQSLKIDTYDVKALKGMPGMFRIRKGGIRIVFIKKEDRGIVVDVAFRKDIYKHSHV